MNYTTTFLIVILWVGSATAQITITEPVLINLSNGSYITLEPLQTMTSMKTFNETDSSTPSTLQIILPGTQLLTTTDANMTLSSIKYSIPEDNLSYNTNGAANFNMTARMGASNEEYLIIKNTVNGSIINSTTEKYVMAVQAISGSIDYIIRKLIPPVIIPYGIKNPIITFTDTSCLGGSICTTKIHVYSGNNQIGTLNSTGTYISMSNQTDIKVLLEDSPISQLNSPNQMQSTIINSRGSIFAILVAMGIVFTIYFLIKNMFSRRG